MRALLAGEHHREVLGCWAFLLNQFLYERWIFVQNRDVGKMSKNWELWERGQLREWSSRETLFASDQSYLT